MAKPPRPWTVTPHGPIEPLDEDLWAVESSIPGVPGGAFPRRMTIARREDGTLLMHNALPLDDAGLARLRELGRPTTLIVPNQIHCLDADAFRERLGVQAYAPAASLAVIRGKTRLDGAIEELPPDDRCRFLPLAGLSSGELVLAVTSPDGARVSLMFADQLLNVPHQPGFWGFVYKVMGLTGGPRVGPIWRKRYVTDAAAYRRSFEALADLPKLARLVPSHGPVIEREPDAAIREVVRRL